MVFSQYKLYQAKIVKIESIFQMGANFHQKSYLGILLCLKNVLNLFCVLLRPLILFFVVFWIPGINWVGCTDSVSLARVHQKQIDDRT